MDTSSFFTVLATAISVFLIAIIGALLRKKGRLSDQVDHSLMWLLINISLPSLVITSIIKNPALDHLENIFLPPVLGFSSVLIGWGLALLLYRFSGISAPQDKKSFLLSNAINNYGFVPIPLILALYDRETLGVLFMHNIGVEAAIWSIGILIISGSGGNIGHTLKRLINAPLCAITSCLILTYFDLDTHIPGFVLKTTGLLGQAAIPIALLIVGSLMYDCFKTFEIRNGLRVALSSVAIRLVLFPICYLTFLLLIPMSLELKRVVLIESAQPAALLPIVLAKQYGANPQVAFLIILSTSLLSLITMPLWIQFGSSLF
jgi:predicted permease